ncbi:hypothetical protein ASPSYDRAFT_25956 [Aspergillus sydowii CBS 593.65]|uniref:3',5'-cyclic-nucleotide phosphodiesterase n=1 Tax=Aspergillus sydowii CBS 593.65 TaxID=1036612 RepID=A0A1L9TWV2_9EURO|nr:uncharacterized protein ASPSYDRAFT_25956 [Aspergillus sydowii CBS 593.65]OJJ63919.1 hypothetical protein ASPSYDRAFT_25956 [Aspergillus sydowii CBS 593.65]
MTPGPAPDIANSNDLDNRHSEDSKRVGIKADHYAQDGPVRAEGTGVGSSKFPCVDSSDKHVKFSEINVNDCGKKNGKDRNALHVVVLGPTGGPREDRVTGLLVRSLATDWAPNSMIVVDAGVLLSGIIEALRDCESEDGVLTSGAFVGLQLPHQSPEANGAYIFKKIIGSILITHSHLDHVSALAVNTPALTSENGPKTVAALPSVIHSLKTHIFNDSIWPNLSDEDGGVGFITYQRLVDGGNPMMGFGEERGYIQACDGLLARCLGVSHGRCKSDPSPEAELSRRSSNAWLLPTPDRRRQSQDATANGSLNISSPSLQNPDSSFTSFDSSAFFLRDQYTGAEIIIFGDVEPDSVSVNPRNQIVWEMAAPKVASGQLCAIFIECSFTNAVDDLYLFGHLCPRHLVQELDTLATLVAREKDMTYPAVIKRKREGSSDPIIGQPSPKWRAKDKGKGALSQGLKRATKLEDAESAPLIALDRQTIRREADVATEIPKAEKPLSGLSVYIIHVKEDLTDGPHPRETILEELNDLEKIMGLGCEFHTPVRGESIYL